MFRFLLNCCFFAAPIFLILLGIASFFLNRIFGDFNPKKVDRATLVRIMQLRDFRTFSEEKRRQMTDRCEKEFGRQSKQKPTFEFSGIEKKIYTYFQAKRRSQREHDKQSAAPISLMENNLSIMARIRYFQWMNDYEHGDPPQQRALMNGIADDMKYWQSIYMAFLRASDQPIPPLMELIQEFEMMIDGFKIEATPEEVGRIDSFKQQMNAAIVAREVQGAARNIGNLGKDVGSAISHVFGNLMIPDKKDRPKSQNNSRKNSKSGKD